MTKYPSHDDLTDCLHNVLRDKDQSMLTAIAIYEAVLGQFSDVTLSQESSQHLMHQIKLTQHGDSSDGDSSDGDSSDEDNWDSISFSERNSTAQERRRSTEDFDDVQFVGAIDTVVSVEHNMGNPGDNQDPQRGDEYDTIQFVLSNDTPDALGESEVDAEAAEGENHDYHVEQGPVFRPRRSQESVGSDFGAYGAGQDGTDAPEREGINRIRERRCSQTELHLSRWEQVQIAKKAALQHRVQLVEDEEQELQVREAALESNTTRVEAQETALLQRLNHLEEQEAELFAKENALEDRRHKLRLMQDTTSADEQRCRDSLKALQREVEARRTELSRLDSELGKKRDSMALVKDSSIDLSDEQGPSAALQQRLRTFERNSKSAQAQLEMLSADFEFREAQLTSRVEFLEGVLKDHEIGYQYPMEITKPRSRAPLRPPPCQEPPKSAVCSVS